MKIDAPRRLAHTLCALAGMVTTSARAQQQGNEDKLRLVYPSGSQIVTRAERQPLFPESTYALGVFTETLRHRAAERFRPQPPGLGIALDQHLRGFLSGGLQARILGLERREQDGNDNVVSLALVSRIEAAPRFGALAGLPRLDVVRPFVRAGLGFLWFGIVGSRLLEHPPDLRNEESLTVGGGLRIHVTPSLGIQGSWEYLRGTRTYNFVAHVWQLEMVVGDLDAR